jgi:hypothetical protein
MKRIHSFNDFNSINESVFGKFEGNIQYSDWSDFRDKLRNAVLTGFNSIEELFSLMSMNIETYTKIKEHMILHWKNSVSQSIIHSIAELNYKIPKKGTNIFKDLKTQTQFLILTSIGYHSRDIYGGNMSVNGLGLLNKFGDLEKVKNTDPKQTERDRFTNKEVMKKYALVAGTDAYTVKSEESIKKVNNILQYIWLYIFYNHYILKKGIKEKTHKLPKYLYRGIRGTMWPKAEKAIGKEWSELTKLYTEAKVKHNKVMQEKYDLLFDYIIKNGIHKLTDGKFISFTASMPIARYFSNKDGFILRVETSKVNIISSELTEDLFDQEDYVSNRKEHEYIIVVPKNYKFEKDDIIVTDEDYLIATNNPLCVGAFSHDTKEAYYDMLDDKGVKWNVNAYYVWTSNDKGGVIYAVKKDDEESYSWAEGRNSIKKRFGFSPLPTEDNLDRISNFRVNDEKKRW